MTWLRVSAVVVCLTILMSACARPEPASLAGRWESTSSGAWIEIEDDLSYVAEGWPIGVTESADGSEDVTRTGVISGSLGTRSYDRSGVLMDQGGDGPVVVRRTITGRVEIVITTFGGELDEEVFHKVD